MEIVADTVAGLANMISQPLPGLHTRPSEPAKPLRVSLLTPQLNGEPNVSGAAVQKSFLEVRIRH